MRNARTSFGPAAALIPATLLGLTGCDQEPAPEPSAAIAAEAVSANAEQGPAAEATASNPDAAAREAPPEDKARGTAATTRLPGGNPAIAEKPAPAAALPKPTPSPSVTSAAPADPHAGHDMSSMSGHDMEDMDH